MKRKASAGIARTHGMPDHVLPHRPFKLAVRFPRRVEPDMIIRGRGSGRETLWSPGRSGPCRVDGAIGGDDSERGGLRTALRMGERGPTLAKPARRSRFWPYVSPSADRPCGSLGTSGWNADVDRLVTAGAYARRASWSLFRDPGGVAGPAASQSTVRNIPGPVPQSHYLRWRF